MKKLYICALLSIAAEQYAINSKFGHAARAVSVDLHYSIGQLEHFYPTLDEQLINAASASDLTRVKTLLWHGADPNAREENYGITVLMYAALGGIIYSPGGIRIDEGYMLKVIWGFKPESLMIMKELIDYGADKQAVDYKEIDAQGHLRLKINCFADVVDQERQIQEALDLLETSTIHNR